MSNLSILDMNNDIARSVNFVIFQLVLTFWLAYCPSYLQDVGKAREQDEYRTYSSENVRNVFSSRSLRDRQAIDPAQTVLSQKTLKSLPDNCFSQIFSVLVQYAG